MPEDSDDGSEGWSNSKIAVAVIVALILLGGIAWVVWAIRMGAGTPPEKAKAMAKNAERQCVLDGVEPSQCEELVGEHHRDCLAEMERQNEGIAVDEGLYLDCMRRAMNLDDEKADEEK